MSELVLGIDVGTQSARVIALNAEGVVVAEASESFVPATSALPFGYFEQNPLDWWKVVSSCLHRVVSQVGGRFSSIAVDSTSGTIVSIDKAGRVLRPAIMYNDTRSTEEAQAANAIGALHTAKLGYQFNASFGLPKILWIRNNEPDVYKIAKFIHAADYITGRLTGNFMVSDSSNALKTGYDLVESKWPEFIVREIESDKLPFVLQPGESLGQVTEECAKETGLCAGTQVTAGVSDGTAGFLASGASKVGDWNTTLGTTLVMRGFSRDLIIDPIGRFYCHRHPEGWWLPGGASNVGGEAIAKLFAEEDLNSLTEAAAQYIPTGLICYPLVRTGERLPFVDPDAQGFFIGQTDNKAHLFAAYLEGIAFVERWILDVAAELGADTSGEIYTTGGGAKNQLWMKIRSNVLNRRVNRPIASECAVGAAIVAASKTLFNSLTEAGSHMVKTDTYSEPESSLVSKYEDLYARFRSECFKRFAC